MGEAQINLNFLENLQQTLVGDQMSSTMNKKKPPINRNLEKKNSKAITPSNIF